MFDILDAMFYAYCRILFDFLLPIILFMMTIFLIGFGCYHFVFMAVAAWDAAAGVDAEVQGDAEECNWALAWDDDTRLKMPVYDPMEIHLNGSSDSIAAFRGGDGEFPTTSYKELAVFLAGGAVVFENGGRDKWEIVGVRVEGEGDTGFYVVDGVMRFCIAGVTVLGWEMGVEELEEMFTTEAQRHRERIGS